MNQFDAYALLIAFFAFIVFFAYLLFDLAMSDDTNAFLNKWFTKSVWFWLPFYALQRLIREVLLKK